MTGVGFQAEVPDAVQATLEQEPAQGQQLDHQREHGQSGPEPPVPGGVRGDRRGHHLIVARPEKAHAETSCERGGPGQQEDEAHDEQANVVDAGGVVVVAHGLSPLSGAR